MRSDGGRRAPSAGAVLALLLPLLAVLLCPAAARAILYIDINAPGGKRMPIALADFAGTSGDPGLASAIPKVIADDLAMTSLFDVVPRAAHLEKIVPSHFSGKRLSFPDWKLIGAEAVVIGYLEAKGNQVTVEMRLYDATLGAMMVGRRYTGPPARYRAIAHKFANEILHAFTGVRGIFDTEIVFTARPKAGRGKELYAVGLDGQDFRPLTGNRSFNLFPRWSPDGRTLAYTSFRTGTPVIYVRDVAEGTERPLVRFGNTKVPGSFTPSGDALYAAVSIGGDADIYRVSLKGGSADKVVSGFGLEVSPSVSPDGKRIAFVSNRTGTPQVYVKALGAGSEIRISNAGGYATSPAWSPAGDRIAFTAQSGGRFSIHTVNPDGSDPRLVVKADGDCTDPSWSPDGRYLVYTFQKKGYSELKIISADGRWGRTLFSGLSGAGSPAWSPRR